MDWNLQTEFLGCLSVSLSVIMPDASEVSVSNIFIEQIKTAIRNRKVSNKRPDVKAIYQYVSKHFASNLNENDIVSYIASMVDKNMIVNNATLKGDSCFIVAGSKTQQGIIHKCI